MPEVSLEQVSKTYTGGVKGVADLSLTVADGECLVLVGPSGCGKTTTLRLIAGLDTPSTGLVRLGGQVVNDVPSWRRGVALAFQRPALYPHWTVRANLGMGLVLSRGPGWAHRLAAVVLPNLRRRYRQWRVETANRIQETARVLDLEDLLDRRPATLSGGQQQRVALGRALVRQPAVLLLDEPLSNLDAGQRLELRRQLLLLHRRIPATMVYVTHDPGEAMALGERVAVLRDGVLQQVGRPRDVYNRPCNRFVAGFLGWPPMNFLEGDLVREAGRLRLQSTAGSLHLPNDWSDCSADSGVLGIRPESVQLMAREADHTPRDHPSLEMVISLIEPQGPFSLVRLISEKWEVTAVARRPELREGQKVTVVFRLEQAHLFDRITGLALVAGYHTG
jgi:multiple sugar transport system ATP-binding protein